jgi:hypothetical protein
MSPEASARALTVGVTGHRAFTGGDSQAFRRAVVGVLESLEHVQGQAVNRPNLLTGLAAGADCLVTELALERGWTAVAVLAAPVEDFEGDFTPGAPLEMFRALLQRVDEVVVTAPTGTPSPDRYCRVGDWLVERSDHLIAVWDRDMSRPKAGGAAWVVQRFLKQDDSAWERVHHIQVQRS